ncbi:MAG: penicillin-binding protein activator LpoB [Bdellovibrionota bacterium]
MLKITKSMHTHAPVFFVLSLLTLGSACTKSFEGEYSDPSAVEIVDDRWNESDARKSAEVLIKSMLVKPWLKNFKSRHDGQRPVLIIDDVENRTDEHLDIKALMEAIRDELINSGKIRFVNASRRQKILDEIKYQQESGRVSSSSAKKKGRQTGADFLLGGAISSSVHSMDELKTVTYQVNLILTNLESAEIEWSQKHSIKKRFKRAGTGW